MEPTSFDVLDTVVFPIVGGVIAGIIVILVQWTFRAVNECRQRHNAENALREFFEEWEDTINGATALNGFPTGHSLTTEQLQYTYHKDYLRRADSLIVSWSRLLSEKQMAEINYLVQGHKGNLLDILPANKIPNQWLYDNFFRQAREISWLKF